MISGLPSISSARHGSSLSPAGAAGCRGGADLYRKIAARLADEFHAELRGIIHQAAENPRRFHIVDQGLRRANLKRFPYHVVYELRAVDLRVMLVRHNKRHPRYGLPRE